MSTIRKVFLQRAPNVLTLSLYLLIRAFDEMVAWSIDTHIMGMSLYPTQESTPDHIDTNQLAINS